MSVEEPWKIEDPLHLAPSEKWLTKKPENWEPPVKVFIVSEDNIFNEARPRYK